MVVSQRDWATPPKFYPLPYRLLDSADGPETLTGHQKLGLMFQSDDCSSPNEAVTACSVEFGAAKLATAGPNWRGANPFVLYTWLDCGLVSLGGTQAEATAELKRRTLAAHRNNYQTIVEEIFWTGGAHTTHPHLAANAAVTEVSGGSTVVLQTAATLSVTSGNAVRDPVEAIGALEEAMAGCYGGTPFIHMPRAGIAALTANRLVEAKGQRLVTKAGSVIVAAPGYPGTSPAGAAPTAGTTWVYATGSVKAWQSEPVWTARDAREFLGRNINDTVLILEQWFALAWDCCHFAIQMDLGGVIDGAPFSAH